MTRYYTFNHDNDNLVLEIFDSATEAAINLMRSIRTKCKSDTDSNIIKLLEDNKNLLNSDPTHKSFILGYTLHLSAVFDHGEVIKFIEKKLIDEGRPINVNKKIAFIDKETQPTLLTIAAAEGSKKAVEAILAITGCDINATDALKNTALISLTPREKEDAELAQTLIDRGCDLNKKNCLGFSAIMCADYQGNENLKEFFLEKGATYSKEDKKKVKEAKKAEKRIKKHPSASPQNPSKSALKKDSKGCTIS